jgi:hypothetical protein
MDTYNKCIYFILTLKIVFVLLALLHFYYKITNQVNTKKNKQVDPRECEVCINNLEEIDKMIPADKKNEKTAIEKERLYHEIKLENDQIANQSYKMQRGIEELVNEKRILETKLKNCEAILRQTQEEYRQMKVAHDKADATAKLLSEQLDSAKKTIEEISLK